MAVTVDGVPEDMTDARCVGAKRRHRALGHLCRDEAETFEDAGPRKVLIDVVFEDDVDHREAERRLRADHAHAGEAAQVHGERVADLVFDFLRTVAGPVGEHDDLVVGEIRNRIDRRGGGRPPPPASERHREPDG